MSENVWFTLRWKNRDRTIPDVRSIWLGSELLSVWQDNGTFIAMMSAGDKIMLENCQSLEEAQKVAVRFFRAKLEKQVQEIQKTIDLLKNNE